LKVRLGENHHKLITSITGDGIDITNTLGDNLGDLSKYLVADQMSVTIIDLFEIINIDKDEGQRRLIPRRSLKLSIDNV